MKLFGKSKAPPPKESLAQLRNSVSMLEKREEFLQKKADQEVELGACPRNFACCALFCAARAATRRDAPASGRRSTRRRRRDVGGARLGFATRVAGATGCAAPSPQALRAAATQILVRFGALRLTRSHTLARTHAHSFAAKQKLAAKNKTAAMAHLKRKKNYEAQIEKIQGSRLTLETQMVRRPRRPRPAAPRHATDRSQSHRR